MNHPVTRATVLTKDQKERGERTEVTYPREETTKKDGGRGTQTKNKDSDQKRKTYDETNKSEIGINGLICAIGSKKTLSGGWD